MPPHNLAVALMQALGHVIILLYPDKKNACWEELGDKFRQIGYLTYLRAAMVSSELADWDDLLTLGYLAWFAPQVIETLGFHQDGIKEGASVDTGF